MLERCVNIQCLPIFFAASEQAVRNVKLCQGNANRTVKTRVCLAAAYSNLRCKNTLNHQKAPVMTMTTLTNRQLLVTRHLFFDKAPLGVPTDNMIARKKKKKLLPCYRSAQVPQQNLCQISLRNKK